MTHRSHTTLTQALMRYPNRYTMEHVPDWVRRHTGCAEGFYAPQYRSDAEWYANTSFPGDPGHPDGLAPDQCYSTGQTWPRGKWLSKPYRL